MSRFELRYVARHPLRWLRAWSVHWVVGVALIVAAVAKRHEVFGPVLGAELWPWLVGVAGAAAIASSIGPLHRWVVAPAGATLVAVGLLRALAMVEVALHADTSARAAVAVVFACHWTIVVALGFRWDQITMHAARTMMADAARDDRVVPEPRRGAVGG